MNSNERKSALLGEPFGTAGARLRKILLFEAIGRLGERNCYRCGFEIETVEEFSIEHKQSWMNSSNPKEMFFSLDNISFSHLFCNVAEGHSRSRIYETSKDRRRAESQRRWAKDGELDKHNKRRRENNMNKKNATPV